VSINPRTFCSLFICSAVRTSASADGFLADVSLFSISDGVNDRAEVGRNAKWQVARK
jgi:hypothetical protein